MLSEAKVVAFVPSCDLARARAFFVETLGLGLVGEDAYALVLDANGTRIRVTKVEHHEPAPFTILGWEVKDLGALVTKLETRGVRCLRYEVKQDARDLGVPGRQARRVVERRGWQRPLLDGARMSRIGRTLLQAAVLVGCVAGSSGCSTILGVDDYTVAHDQDGASPVVLPALPAQPDAARREACTQCAVRECGPQRDACVGSPSCRAMLACQGQCGDPNCLGSCVAQVPRSLAFEDYFACVFGNGVSQCPGDCGAANNWGCIDDGYRWDQPRDPRTLVMDLELSGQATGAGWEVASCMDGQLGALVGDDCDGWVRMDAYGRAQLRFEDLANASLALRASQGVAGLRNVADDRERVRAYGRPLAHSGLVLLPVASAAFVSIATAVTPGVDPSLGIVAFGSSDCLGVPTPAIVTLPGVAGSSPFYGADGILRSNPPLENGFFVNVPPSSEVEIVGSVGDRVVSRRTISVKPPWISEVSLWPLDSLSIGR
jgi:hypothetical protein